MAISKEKRTKLLDIVLLSFTVPIDILAAKYGESTRTIKRWQRIFAEDGTIDVAEVMKSLKKEEPTEVVVETMKIETQENPDKFTQELLDARLYTLRKMKKLVKDEEDLDKVTRAFKAMSDSVVVVVGDSGLRARNPIFEAAEIIEENMQEIEDKKQLYLSQHEESSND